MLDSLDREPTVEEISKVRYVKCRTELYSRERSGGGIRNSFGYALFLDLNPPTTNGTLSRYLRDLGTK